MSEPFIGEVRIWGVNYAPRDWAFCDGQLIAINQNQALYALYGTTFGGDGHTTFAVPDLRGRVPMHPELGVPQGVRAGVEDVTLLTSQMPAHTHALEASNTAAASATPVDTVFAQGDAANLYGDATGTLADLNAATIGTFGGGQAHDNVQPSLVLNFCLALTGLFPSRN